ncbi:hypothetical protein [Pseudonocardia spinosispora]|uniref:hypothetical protein n=1 Tax=Pseudonocardia spinosispora TaxID=103441 RepID=UPI000401873D|nr:hypothetical protein [Pseudonocardia spinosispora]
MRADLDADPELSFACAARLVRLADDVAAAAARVAGSSVPVAVSAAAESGRDTLAALLACHSAELTSVADEVRRAARGIVEQENAAVGELRALERRLASGPSLITRVLG